MNHPTTAARSLYEAILREPWDDAHRLVYADYLDEHPRDDNDRVRAEFIRLQMSECRCVRPGSHPSCESCHTVNNHIMYGGIDRELDAVLGLKGEWMLSALKLNGKGPGLRDNKTRLLVTFSRGFPHAVAMTMQAFVGAECNCRSFQSFAMAMLDGKNPARMIRDCRNCHGTGRTPGLASVICAKWPVTEIRLVGREPWDTGPSGWAWWQSGVQVENRASLPKVIYDLLSPQTKIRGDSLYYSTRESAMLALSHAAVAYARELAGRPPLKWMTNANNPRLDVPADRPVHAGNRPNDRLSGPRLSQ